MGSPALRYTGLRLLLFAVSAGVLYLLGLRGLLLAAVALLLSGVLSWFLLSSQRTAMGDRIQQRIARANARIDAATRAEDDAEPPTAPEPGREPR